MISESEGAIREGGYNPIRGDRVIAFAKNFLDETFPLENGTFNKATNFEFIDSEIVITLNDGSKTHLLNKDQYIGYMDKGESAYGLLFKNNNLQDLKQTINKLDQEDMSKIWLNQIEHISNNYSMDKVLQKWIYVYKNFLFFYCVFTLS